MPVTLTFHGAAGTVTGSSYRVSHPNGQFIVDLGMFQGNKTLQQLNSKPLPYKGSDIDFVLLTHAHVDHSGLLPRLTAANFTGKVHATPQSVDLLKSMLADSAKIQESETKRRNARREKQGREPQQPLYTLDNAREILANCKGHKLGTWFKPGKGVRVRGWNAGHILGSASLEVEVNDDDGKPIRILFSGDIGPDEKVFYKEPNAPSGFDYILCEGTYGNRDRPNQTLDERRDGLQNALETGLLKGGNVLIPSFAVERSQELLHDIAVLLNEGRIPNATVYLDSPLARRVTKVFEKYADTLEDIKIPKDQLFKHPNLKIVQSVNQSKGLNQVTKNAIILAASGMCEAGRIKHHLRNNLWRKKATVLFVGYQAPGTLGSIIQRKKAKEVFIHGRRIKLGAAVETLGGYSAHADQAELVRWIKERQPAHCGLFITHAEERGRSGLHDKLVEDGFSRDKIFLPELDESFTLSCGGDTQTIGRNKRIEDESLVEDWTGQFAAFNLELMRKLDDAPSDAERSALVSRMLDVLNAPK